MSFRKQLSACRPFVNLTGSLAGWTVLQLAVFVNLLLGQTDT